MKKMARFFLLPLMAFTVAFTIAAESYAAADDHRKGTVQIKVVTKSGRVVKSGSLKIEQVSSDVYFGALSSAMTSEENYAKLVSVFNSVTFGAFWGKPELPGTLATDVPGVYNPTSVGQLTFLMNELDKRGQLYMTGHPILYNLPSVQPNWLTKENQMMEYQRHLEWWIRTFDKVKVADVVNEQLHYPIADAFAPYQWAKTLKPSLRLRTNEYDVINSGYDARGKRTGIIDQYIEMIRQNSNLVDIIGVQSHVGVGKDQLPSDATIKANLDALAQLGKPIHITEISIPSADNQYAKGWTEQDQADYIVKLYTLYFNHPKVELISYWDVAAPAWNPSSSLWREDGSAKPAWDALKTLITKTWRTNLTQKIPSSGTFTFTGYRGKYKINGQEFVLDKTVGKTWKVVMK